MQLLAHLLSRGWGGMQINRSVCIVVAFLMEQEGMSLLEAVHLVKTKRGCVLVPKDGSGIASQLTVWL